MGSRHLVTCEPLPHSTIGDLPDAVYGKTRQEIVVVADDDQRAAIGIEGGDEEIDGCEVEVIGGLVEDQQLRWRVGQQQGCEGSAETLAARQGPPRGG